jgi:hypothetical protein
LFFGEIKTNNIPSYYFLFTLPAIKKLAERKPQSPQGPPDRTGREIHAKSAKKLLALFAVNLSSKRGIVERIIIETFNPAAASP